MISRFTDRLKGRYVAGPLARLVVDLLPVLRPHLELRPVTLPARIADPTTIPGCSSRLFAWRLVAPASPQGPDLLLAFHVEGPMIEGLRLAILSPCGSVELWSETILTPWWLEGRLTAPGSAPVGGPSSCRQLGLDMDPSRWLKELLARLEGFIESRTEATGDAAGLLSRSGSGGGLLERLIGRAWRRGVEYVLQNRE